MVAALACLVLAGCGGKDDQLDREQLVPQGMRRTTVTTHDIRTETADGTEVTPRTAPATPPAPAPEAAAAGAGDAGAGLPIEPAADFAAEAPAAEPVAPDSAAVPAIPPAAPPAGAFVVQAGAFKQLATAEGVVEKLRGLEIAARIEATQAGGATLHRVVVPGLADRAAADALVARLEQELGIDAVVRTP
jgi:cell division septation protein DedD